LPHPIAIDLLHLLTAAFIPQNSPTGALVRKVRGVSLSAERPDIEQSFRLALQTSVALYELSLSKNNRKRGQKWQVNEDAGLRAKRRRDVTPPIPSCRALAT
jgi:hypothetical protein